MAKHTYNMESETRTVVLFDGRPSVRINGITYIGKARKSRMRIGEDVEVLYRSTRECKSVTVKPTRAGSRVPEERWISVDAFLSKDE